MSHPLTNNPFGHATKNWLHQHMYPPNKTTKVPAGVVLPQMRSADASLHTHLCGNGLFEVKATYDSDRDKLVNTSVHFNVPFFGRLEFAKTMTGFLRRPIRANVPADCAPITGYVEILELDSEGGQIALGYDLQTPYGNLQTGKSPVALFPVDSGSLQAQEWYKDVPVMTDSTVAALRAIPESPVKRGNPDVGYEHVVLAVDRAQNDQQKTLLQSFFDAYTRKHDILIPATPHYYRPGGRADVPAPKQKTIRLRFLNFFQLNGTINLDTLYINAILSIFVPIAHNAHTCQIRGNLGDVAGVVTVLDEPLMHGLVNLYCDPDSPERTVCITLKLAVSLIGAVKETDYPLLSVPKQD